MLSALVVLGIVAVAVKIARQRGQANWSCPTCGTRAWTGSGVMRRAYGREYDDRSCRKCGRVFSEADKRVEVRVGKRREGPQVVGFPCAVCGARIVFDEEGVPCDVCGKPTHVTCLPHTHDDKSTTPYRG